MTGISWSTYDIKYDYAYGSDVKAVGFSLKVITALLLCTPLLS